jgi:hypothetical protein
MTFLLLAAFVLSAEHPVGDTVSSPRDTLRIEFLRKPDRLLVGQRIQLLARAVDADGTPLADPVAWRASSSSYVSLAADGRITGITAGRLTIMAVLGDLVEPFELEVVPNVLGALELTPTHAVARVGEEVSFEFQALDTAGTPIEGILAGWELTSQLDASIHDDGRFVARVPGLHTVVAVVGDRKAIATVRVAPR